MTRKHPADAHDARLPPRHICAITGVKRFASVCSLGRACDQKATRLMLMMLASRLVTSVQSLGRSVLQAFAAWGGHVTRKVPG